MSLQDITLGRYVYGESVVHRLDPRTKLIAMLVMMTVLFTGGGWRAPVIAAVFILAACILSGLSLSYILRSLLPFKWLILVTFLLNVLFIGGHTVIEAPLPYGGITEEGLRFGILYSLRISLLILMSSLVTLTTQPVTLVGGVEKLLGPTRRIGLNPHEIALAMVITIRFVPVFIDEAVKIRKSFAARGLRPGGGPIVRLRAVSMLLLPLFVNAVRRAEELAVAMECRLYRSSAVRTRYHDTRMTLIDWTAVGITFIFAIMMWML